MRGAAQALQALLLIAAVAAAIAAIAAPFDNQEPHYNSKCLLCMCKALGNGSCEAGGECKAKDCFGPFRITKPYWISAGSPVQPGDNVHLPGAFRRCVEEPFCAVRTIQAIMSQGVMKDYDRDGRISCIDLHIAHMYGRNYASVPDLSSGLFPYLKTCLNWSEPISSVAPPKPSTPKPAHVGPRGATTRPPSRRNRDPYTGTSVSTGAGSYGSASFNGGLPSRGVIGGGNVNNAPRQVNPSRDTSTQAPHRGYDSNGPTRTGWEMHYGTHSGRGY